ncbi:MAG: RNA polymerase factor sigma-54 [Gammaproteobacteria bacterium]|nr:MAG: RNA polymerase factor sigma-54 [Gammaproteobacteria bacterium]
MKPSLQLRIGQQLVMTPQLQQALRLLQLPVLELNAQLQQALDENVMLDQDDPSDREDATTTSLDELPAETGAEIVTREADDSGPWDLRDRSGSRSDPWADDYRRPEPTDHSDESLREHLLWQLELENFPPREAAIGQAIIDALDEDGYLTEPLEEILAALPADGGFRIEEVHRALQMVQTLDPAGVGARNLGECLRIQLAQLDPETPALELALAIATDGLDAVASRDLASLRRRLQASEAELAEALQLIRACHPRPGAAIAPPGAEYVVPDVYVRKQDGRWIVEVNRSGIPRLRVNQAYADMLKSERGHETLRHQLQEARFLVRSLEIRDDTLLKVAHTIVSRQTGFLERGEEAMKPMILRDVAEAIGMHESTISRVTSNKYMHTPRGVFEFKYFFSSQLAGTDGSEQSSTAIKARIRRLIGQENPAKPLSDSKIAALLTEEGIRVARRTVAKYREAMRIAPSSERKRLNAG